jgi:bisphosphoglycerate-independent phosphoglycerate mutase (AlkP superfamily)
VPEVYFEQFGITKAIIHLLALAIYIEKFGIIKIVIHLLVSGPDTSRCMASLAIPHCSI